MTMIRCNNCKREIPSDSKACTFCGTAVRKKKNVLIIVLACLGGAGLLMFMGLVLLAFFVSAGHQESGSASDPPSTPAATATTTATAETPKQAKIGDTVEAGDFIYRIDRVSYQKSLGNEFTNKTADGIFLIVSLSLKKQRKREQDAGQFPFQAPGRQRD